MDLEKKIDLVSRPPTEEIVTKKELREVLETKTHPVSYWGIAPTGPPHIGYYKTFYKQKDLVDAGFKHKILIADFHAYLDDMKSPWEELKTRSEVYKKCLQLLGLEGKNIEYVTGSDFQLRKDYQMELFRALPLVTSTRATRAASEVCRMTNPKVSSLVYPIMQSLDCWALDVDLAYSGVDNRHAYMLARELFPKLKHKVPVVVLSSLGISISGGKKMDASRKEGRLELFTKPDDIKNSINKAYCPAGVLKGNFVIDVCKYVIFPRIKEFKIERDKKFGGDISFSSYEELEREFRSKKVHPQDLKNSTAGYLIDVLKPIRDYFDKHPNMLKTFKS